MHETRDHTRPLLAGSLLALILVGSGMGPVQDTDPRKSVQQAMKSMTGQTGTFDFEVDLDLTPLGQPGVRVEISGTSRGESVLGGTGILGVSEANDQQSLSYIGYRTDTKEYFLVALDPEQTSLTYMSGKFARPGFLKLADPMTGVTSDMQMGPEGTLDQSIRIPPDQDLLMKITSKRTSADPGQVLADLLSGPIVPDRINRSADSPEPGRNYARAHRLLHRMAGDFTSVDGASVKSRVVAGGRYLISYFPDGDGMIQFMAWNNGNRLFQALVLSPAIGHPIYLQGAMDPDGALKLADPFVPSGMKMTLTLGSGGFRSETTLAGKVIESRDWKSE